MCNKLVCLIFVLKNVLVLGVIVLKEHEHIWTEQTEPNFKYTADQLLMSDFPKKTSDDFYLDPCKAGKSNY